MQRKDSFLCIIVTSPDYFGYKKLFNISYLHSFKHSLWLFFVHIQPEMSNSGLKPFPPERGLIRGVLALGFKV